MIQRLVVSQHTVSDVFSVTTCDQIFRRGSLVLWLQTSVSLCTVTAWWKMIEKCLVISRHIWIELKVKRLHVKTSLSAGLKKKKKRKVNPPSSLFYNSVHDSTSSVSFFFIPWQTSLCSRGHISLIWSFTFSSNLIFSVWSGLKGLLENTPNVLMWKRMQLLPFSLPQEERRLSALFPPPHPRCLSPLWLF